MFYKLYSSHASSSGFSITLTKSAEHLRKTPDSALKGVAPFSILKLFSFLLDLLQRGTNGVLRILVIKPSPALEAPGHGHLAGLGIRLQDLGLPDECSLGHCGLSATFLH